MLERNDEHEEFKDIEPLENDDSTEEIELEDLEDNHVATIKKLKLSLKECEKEKMGHLENLHRAKAEFLNGKRRLEEEKILDKERAITKQIEKLLPMFDSFYMAFSDEQTLKTIDQTWRKGIESIYNQLQTILKEYQVIEIYPLGMEFNPAFHEALTNINVSDKKQHNKVMSVVQKGFARNIHGKEHLIRPARVTVGTYTE